MAERYAAELSDELAGKPDHEVDLDFHFLDADSVAAGLSDADFSIVSRTEREPWPDEAQSRRCYILARRGTLSSPEE